MPLARVQTESEASDPVSYTRFSPDSDVFVYRSVKNTWVVSVASQRFQPQAGHPVPVHPTPDAHTPESYAAALADYRSAIDHGTTVPIGGRRDGQHFQTSSPGDCATLLGHLREEGYRVPPATMARLRAEQSPPTFSPR